MIIGELMLRFIAPDETTDARAQELYDLLAPVVLDIESYAVVRLTNARIEDAELEGVQLIAGYERYPQRETCRSARR